MSVCVIPDRVGAIQRRVFRERLTERGAHVTDNEVTPMTTHIITKLHAGELAEWAHERGVHGRLLVSAPAETAITCHTPAFVTKCLKSGVIADPFSFRVYLEVDEPLASAVASPLASAVSSPPPAETTTVTASPLLSLPSVVDDDESDEEYQAMRRREVAFKKRAAQSTCYHCRAVGHWALECPVRLEERRVTLQKRGIALQPGMCRECGSRGHDLRSCPLAPRYGGGRRHRNEVPIAVADTEVVECSDSDEAYTLEAMLSQQRDLTQRVRASHEAARSTDATMTANAAERALYGVQEPTAKRNRWTLKQRAYFACQREPGKQKENLNTHITSVLEELASLYESSGGAKNQWRTMSYQKAARKLAHLPFKVTSSSQVAHMYGFGRKLCAKIDEIIQTNTLRLVDNLKEDTQITTTRLFASIWGVGTKTAERWYQQGLRTLGDVVAMRDQLTHNQQLGLAHRADLAERIPREEVRLLGWRIERILHDIDPQLMAVICGSYRRGAATCGDIDILITHPDGKSHTGVLSSLVPRLHAAGILVSDFTGYRDADGGKYMGLASLGPNARTRHLDFFIVEYGSSWGCSILSHTGDAYFNRSLRTAAKKLGYSLSDKALVRRLSDDAKSELPVPGLFTEAAVFQALGLEYRKPTERNVSK